MNTTIAAMSLACSQLETKTLLIMRHQLLSFLVKHNQDFQSDTVVIDNGGWRSLRNDSQDGFLAAKWVMAGKSRYICTRSGVCCEFRCNRSRSSVLAATVKLLQPQNRENQWQVFGETGIYEYDDSHWRFRATHPYAKGEVYDPCITHLRGHEVIGSIERAFSPSSPHLGRGSNAIEEAEPG
jgi:hypothetical protein